LPAFFVLVMGRLSRGLEGGGVGKYGIRQVDLGFQERGLTAIAFLVPIGGGRDVIARPLGKGVPALVQQQPVRALPVGGGERFFFFFIGGALPRGRWKGILQASDKTHFSGAQSFRARTAPGAKKKKHTYGVLGKAVSARPPGQATRGPFKVCSVAVARTQGGVQGLEKGPGLGLCCRDGTVGGA